MPRCTLAFGLRTALELIGLSLALAGGAVAAQPVAVPVSDAEVVRGDASIANVALVFNVGAGFEPAMSILETLAERQQRCTFFVMGWGAERHPDVLRQIAAAGPDIARPGHSSLDLPPSGNPHGRPD